VSANPSASRVQKVAWRPFDYAPDHIGASGPVRIAEFHSSGAHAFSTHAHECLMVTLLLAGSYRERGGAVALDHRPFSLACHPPGFEHEDAFGAAGARLLVIELARDTAFANLPELSHETPRQLESTVALRAALGLRGELVAGRLACALTVEGLLLDLLTDATRETRSHRVGRPRWLAEVVERLRSGYQEPISLASIARDANVHLGHLWRMFRRLEGCSPTTYVQRLRCRHVLRGIGERRQAASLSDLALEAGFSDQSHLTRVFRRVMGTPPGVLRRMLVGAAQSVTRRA